MENILILVLLLTSTLSLLKNRLLRVNWDWRGPSTEPETYRGLLSEALPNLLQTIRLSFFGKPRAERSALRRRETKQLFIIT
jgi:hypothetical protein